MYLVAVRTNAISTPLCSLAKLALLAGYKYRAAQRQGDEVSSDHAAKPPPAGCGPQ